MKKVNAVVLVVVPSALLFLDVALSTIIEAQIRTTYDLTARYIFQFLINALIGLYLCFVFFDTKRTTKRAKSYIVNFSGLGLLLAIFALNYFALLDLGIFNLFLSRCIPEFSTMLTVNVFLFLYHLKNEKTLQRSSKNE